MKNLLVNWKTTSAGLIMISSAVIHLIFQIKGHTADENAWMIAVLATIGGAGLIFAGDSTISNFFIGLTFSLIIDNYFTLS